LSRQKFLEALSFLDLLEEFMDFQIKLFSWPDRGNHLIMITRGVLDVGGLEQVFRELATVTQPLPDCKVVIDLQDALCNLGTADIQSFANGRKLATWSSNHKVAMLAPREVEQYDQLVLLTSGLSKQGFKIAVFYDSKAAVSWLADTM
jgi:hypothetical protein